jgi:hypothetical protein
MSEHNGWMNRETWIINVWLGELNAWDEISLIIRDPKCIRPDRELRNFVTDNFDMPRNGISRDLVSSALGNVNWRELAEHYKEEYAE